MASALSETSSPNEHLVSTLRGQLRANRRRWLVLLALEALGLAVAAPLACFWLMMLLDQMFRLPILGRALAALAFFGVLVWGVRFVARRWRQMSLTEDQVALAIERRTPGVQNRLINAVQIARGSHELSRDVIEENVHALERIQLEQAAQLKPALLRGGLAVLMILVGLVWWLALPESFSKAAGRILNPLHHTKITVAQGKTIHGVGDVPITIQIEGERPESLQIFTLVGGKRQTDPIPVTDANVPYVFKKVTQDVEFHIRGGDFTTGVHAILVPKAGTFTKLQVTYHYPEYIGQAPAVQNSKGDFEAVEGTRAEARYFFDVPLEKGTVQIQGSKAAPLPLVRVSEREWAVDVSIADASAYTLGVKTQHGDAQTFGPFAIRAVKDKEPVLKITEIERRLEIDVDSLAGLGIEASDDFGLADVELVLRPLVGKKTEDEQGQWRVLQAWAGDKQKSLRRHFTFVPAKEKLREGDKVELALRGKDLCPQHAGWTIGTRIEVFIGGEGAALEKLYEDLLKTERDLKQQAESQKKLMTRTAELLGRLDFNSKTEWDAVKDAELKAIRANQLALGKRTFEIADFMPLSPGNVQFGLKMLASTEIETLLADLKGIPTSSLKQKKLAEARVAQERIGRSFEEMAEQFESFRADWELGNMIPYVKMLADRQTKMRDQSKKLVVQSEDYHRPAMQARQTKVGDLCKQIAPVFGKISQRLHDQEPTLSVAFGLAQKALVAESLITPIRVAAEAAEAGRWSDAVMSQGAAAEQLTALHAQLRKAQVEAAQKALAALKEKAKTDLEAQKELEKLQDGTSEDFTKDFPDKMKVEDSIRIREVANKKKNPEGELREFETKGIEDIDRNRIELKQDSGVRQDTDTLKLGSKAEATKELKDLFKGPRNAVQPFIQEKFEDLIGKLLDEADELGKNFQTLNLSTNQNNNDPGEISKLAGRLNSTGAVAATGNKKPPLTEAGGVSRTGRQGARATGKVADQDGLALKGRDKALDGTQEIADQKGLHKLKPSDEMPNPKDTSTGVGGKKIDSNDNHFSLKDSGKWKDEYVKKMDKPQPKHYIVEHQGEKIDQKVVDQLFDHTAKQQEQVIERLKAIKKELNSLFLPTDHLDPLIEALSANLESLKDRPDAEMFRQQMQTLDKLRSAVRVFQTASQNIELSTSRERSLRGKILDEPNSAVLPGYEDAVRQYFLKLAGQ